ncbi:MAG TPA: aldehyde dehydrogenase family protein [Anaerolineales bacterium]|nr:aldehyde dehydrogenase family protein [Anaerolineales bacterium]
MTEHRFDGQTLDPGFIRRPDEMATMPPSSKDEIDTALADLQASGGAWVHLELGQRLAILDHVLEDLWTVAGQWVSVSLDAKGTRGNVYAEAEEWAVFSAVLRNVRLLGKSLRAIRDDGRPLIPGPLTTRPGGQIVAQVFPQSRLDRLLLPGTTAEVWMRPGLTLDEVRETQARFYRRGAGEGKVALVLGAGNISMLIPTDFLYKLFVDGCVVALKLNPVNAYLGPVLKQGFRGLVDAGFLRILYGGVEEGSYLCQHPVVDEIHMTGSDKTYEDIVFGPGPQGVRRKSERKPLIHKRFTGELGNVTPVIVLPGTWSEADIASLGAKLATWLVINAGFNCLTPRVIVQWANWDQRQALNEAIAAALDQVQTRKAYYPKARQRMEKFLSAHPHARQFGSAHGDHLPWTFITGVDPGNPDDICFRNEAFCGLFAETALEAPSPEEFLDRAVSFANQTLWGNLTATIIAHPGSLKDEHIAAALDRAVAGLRYGMILINQFAGLGFLAMTTTWGAYPGNDIFDIQSGTGVTSNVLMFEHPQKSVVKSPFRLSPDPFALTSRTVREFSQKMAAIQYRPSLWKLPGFIWSAMRS